MLSLIPAHTYDYDQLWSLIRNRNQWFIKLRYLAVLSLLLFIFGCKFLIVIDLSSEQFAGLLMVSAAMLIYNLSIYAITKSDFLKDEAGKFNPMLLSFIQIQLDLLSLGLLVYYTGGVESPFYIFYIFHMIIGSMILPGRVIYTIAGAIVISFFGLSFLEFSGVVAHHTLIGYINSPQYNDIEYVLINGFAFGVMMILGVFFANSIASSLYRREQELRITLDKLNEAERIKQRYTMGVVHEIKSPIVAVQSFLDLIIGNFAGPVSDSVGDKIKKARNRSDEAIQIINDVLSISKLKLLDSIAKDELDLPEILRTIINKKTSQAENKEISLQFIDKRTARLTTIGDKNLLEVVFSNLIGNAIKYTNNGGKVEIVISDNENKTEIEICDNGIGIPDTDKEKIFSEFYRASNVRQKSTEGTGLGLSVVKQIIDQHKGSITFESPSRLADDNGPGTSFTVII